MKRIPSYKISEDKFIINNYNNAKPFSSFFPGIAGLWGKPMWVFYCNRGQAIACMGTTSKDGAILEFLAANKAYRHTPFNGFRTFLKIKEGKNSVFYEPFKSMGMSLPSYITQTMELNSYSLNLIEENKKLKIKTTVRYFTLSEDEIPALVRVLKIENTGNSLKNIECLDGLSTVIPYGTHENLLKNSSRLAEGWFGGVTFEGKSKFPVYKLEVEPHDRPEVIRVKGANFYGGFYKSASNKPAYPKFIAEPDIVFGEVKDLSLPDAFINLNGYNSPEDEKAKNKTPCAFGYIKTIVKPKEFFKYTSLTGFTKNTEKIPEYFSRFSKNGYLDKKDEKNKEIIGKIVNDCVTLSSSEKFDNYCLQNYLDNLLRGGYPVTLGKDKEVYYAYSRIHGDMEREYNPFVIVPAYFSSGNGSYRDVNQNRRNDVYFNLNAGYDSIKYFVSLIQTDGFNPLGIIGSEFKVTDKTKILKVFARKDVNSLKAFISGPFSLGEFFEFIENNGIKPKVNREELLNLIINASQKLDNAIPKEGYWSDHWHYNIDLIMSYLAVYPDNLKKLLIGDNGYTYYNNHNVVMPRAEKYVLFKGKPRQLNTVYEDPEKVKFLNSFKESKYFARTKFGRGSVYKTNLLEKLISITANKYASLDFKGVGVELESERSNWNDALNGLSGLFGSSTAESLELKRLLEFLIQSIETLVFENSNDTEILSELYNFLFKLDALTLQNISDFKFWDETHNAKEKFWKDTKFGVSGGKTVFKLKTLESIFRRFLTKLNSGLAKSFDKKTGVINTYFENEAVKYKLTGKKNYRGNPKIEVLKFRQKPLPLFLEGPVHYLRVNKDIKKSKKLYENILKTGLYDKTLKMYKVNAPLTNTSFDIGRLKVFTPGWLENESVWLHMEYKYLFELLRSGLIDEYYETAKYALVPFLDPKVYGRSIFENVSFIASSAHPDKNIHGQGFVARLSGSTAEFISIWLLMNAGHKPFYMENGRLIMKLDPRLHKSLFTRAKKGKEIYFKLPLTGKVVKEKLYIPENSYAFKFLGNTIVTYHNPQRKNTYGNTKAEVTAYRLKYFNGKIVELCADTVCEPFSQHIRSGLVKKIDISLK